MTQVSELYWRQLLDDERFDDPERWPPSVEVGTATTASKVPREPAAVRQLPPLVRAAVHRHLLLRDDRGFARDLLASATRVHRAAGERLVDFTDPGRPADAHPWEVFVVLEGEAKLIGRRNDPRVPELHAEEVHAEPLPTVLGRLGPGSFIGLPQLAWARVRQLGMASRGRPAAALADLERELARLRTAREAARGDAEARTLALEIERVHAAMRSEREELVLGHALPCDYAVEVLPRLGAPADRALVALRLDADAALALLDGHPAFAAMVRQANANHFARYPALAAAMDANPLLRFMDPGRRMLLMQLARYRRLPHHHSLRTVHDTYLAAGSSPGTVALVVRGRGQAFLPAQGGSPPVLVGDLGPGELVGHERLFRPEELAGAHGLDEPVAEPPRPTDVYVEGDSALLEVDWQSLRWLVADQPATRAAALEWYVAGGADEADQPARVVAVVADRPGLGLSSIALGGAVALARILDRPGTAASPHGGDDRPPLERAVVVLDLQGDDNWASRWAPLGYRRTTPTQLASSPEDSGVHCLLPPAAGAGGLELERIGVVWTDALADAHRLMERLRALHGVEVLVISGFDRAAEVMHDITTELAGRGTTIVWLTDDPTGPYAHAGEYPEVLIRVDRVNARYRDRAAALASDVEEHWAQPEGQDHRHAAADGTVRVLDDRQGAGRWDRGDLRGLLDAPLDHPMARAMHRLGRILAGRSVGLALGGGGMWGAAQIALVRELSLAGVPVDYIAGTSFGSVVGGLYAAAGAPALDRLLADDCPDLPRGGVLAVLRTVRDSPFFRATTLHSWRDTRAVQDEVDRLVCATLGLDQALPLACTEIPFMPVSTNLDSCAPFTTMTGSVGFGVRASSGLPPALPGLWRHGQRILDGAMVANVPAETVRNHGAHYVISANVIAPRTRNRFDGRRRDALYDATVGRISDTTRGLFLLGWKAGDDQGRLRADYRVDLWTRGASMLGWWQGQQIVRRTQESLFRDQVGWSIRQHWERRTGDGGSAYRRVRADVEVDVG